ncbi:amino acid adenylation domain-containing protein [Roseovarius aestuarii]|nr:amino acid adenylation domain-containing protein [Roseovarius aestuarii]
MSQTANGPDPGQGWFPLTPPQRDIWFDQLLVPRSAVYSIGGQVRIAGDIDAALLERAAHDVIARSQALSARFVEIDGVPWQRFHRAAQPELSVLDLRTHDDPEGAAQAWCRAAIDRPFRLPDGPLFRHALLLLAPGQTVYFVAFHHLVCDGWGTSVFLQRVAEVYSALRQGRDPGEIAIPGFSDYLARSQKRALSHSRVARNAAYWADRFTDVPPPLFTGFSAACDPPSACHRVGFPRDLFVALDGMARQTGATVLHVFIAALSLYFARTQKIDTMVFGLPTMGRPTAVDKQTIGLCARMAAMPVKIAMEGSFQALLKSVSRTVREGYRHLPVSPAALRHLNHLPDSRRDTLFDVVLSFETQDYELNFAGAPGVTTACVNSQQQNPLSLFVRDLRDGGDITLDFAYRRDIFEPRQVATIERDLRYLLQSLLAKPDADCRTLPIVPPHVARKLTRRWAVGPEGAPFTQPVHDIVRHWAQSHPQAPALFWAGRSINYAHLVRQGERIAWRLLQMGVTPGDRVALCLNRTPELVYAQLGCLMAGAVFVPIDPAYPAARRAMIVEDAAPAVMILDQTTQALGQDDIAVLDLATDARGDSPRDGWRPVIHASAPAYAIFTSGSTGRPKGVLIEHGSLANLCAAQTRLFQIDPSSRILQFASPAFDAAISEVFVTLTAGACLCLAPAGDLVPGGPLAATVRACDASHITMPPSALAISAPEDFPTLRVVVTAGEACPAAVAARWVKGRVLLNGYGPTEATVCATMHRLEIGAESVPIGRPIDGMRTYVLDEHQNPVPEGVIGELYIGGAGVARGYLNDAVQTKTRFIADPFARRGRMYRTGDLARWRADGVLDYVGRIDHQVKLRGYRIELGDVESALAAHPDVAQAAVVMQGDRLVGFVVARSPTLDSSTLYAHLSVQLPSFMIPGSIGFFDALPLTPNGKIDRDSLRHSKEGAPPTPASRDAPGSGTEALICAIFAEVLGRLDIGPSDNFFRNGGHSLLVAQVCTRLGRATGAAVAVRDVFDNPTPAELARVLGKSGRSAQTAPIAPVSVPAPLSFAQERLWFLDRLGGAGIAQAYIMPVVLRLNGPLDRTALGIAIEALIERHTVLATRFFEQDGAVFQEPGGFPAPKLDILHLGKNADLAQAIDAYVAQPFDLTCAPPFRARLICSDDECHVLVMALHHIVGDGWTIDVLMRDLGVAYGAVCRGESCFPAISGIDYAAYATWQRQNTNGFDALMAFWRETLAGLPDALALPHDLLRPPEQSYEGGCVALTIAPDVRDRLAHMARETGTTLFMILLSAFSVFLARIGAGKDIPIGTPIANRGHPDLERLAGLCVNTLVLRTAPVPGMTFREVVSDVRDVALDAYAHGAVPFERIVEDLRPTRSLAHAPLFQVLFSMTSQGTALPDLPGLECTHTPVAPKGAKLDLSLYLEEGEAGLTGMLEYNAGLFSARRANDLARWFMHLLDGLSKAPDALYDNLPLIDQVEQKALLALGTGAPLGPVPGTVVDAICAQPGETVALRQNNIAWSFDTLCQNAGGISAIVGDARCVAIALDRGPWLSAAELGVLMAGAHFVPLDPAQPSARIAAVLADCGAEALIVDAGRGADFAHHGLRVIETGMAPAPPPPVHIKLDDLAYVIYTSGSTGTPKGVAVTHGNLAAFTTAFGAETGIGPGDVMAALTTPAFDISLTELIVALALGATVAMIDADTARDGLALGALLNARGVTAIQCTPATLRLLVEAEWVPNAPPKVICGGEAFAPDLRAPLLAWGGPVWNMYGPTEATIWSTTHRVKPGDGPVPIGSPLPGWRAHVLDDGFTPLPPGLAGDLYIGGAGLAQRYLNRPDVTQAAFVNTPLGRLYRTGDIARLGENGALDYLGRADTQLKLRGFRIEAGEVEAAFLAQNGVTQAAVMLCEDRLVAFLTAKTAPPKEADLRAALADILPGYMVPRLFIWLEALPLTPNGKIDRKALPPLASQATARGAPISDAAPTDETTALICRLFAQGLALGDVGANDDFFALGGHSLLAMQIAARLGKTLGREIPVKLIFGNPTPAALAGAISAANTPAAPPLRAGAVDVTAPFALSPAQQSLWFLDRLGGAAGQAAYVIPVVVRLTGPLECAALECALDAVIDRHIPLRAVYEMGPGGPRARCVAHAGPLLHLEQGAADLHGKIVQNARQGFNLAKEPPIHATLYALGENDYILHMDLHHITADGWSIQNLMRDLQTAYGQIMQGAPPDLGPLSPNYADYALWQGQRDFTTQLDYWREQLAQLPALIDLPTDRPRPREASHAGARASFAIDRALGDGLRRLARAKGSTVFAAGLAAFGAFLSRIGAGHDLPIGTPVANRSPAQVQPLVGMFVNTVILRLTPHSDHSFDDLLAQSRDLSVAAFANADLPFENLVKALRPDRSLSHAPLFQVMFTLDGADAALPDWPGLTTQEMQIDLGVTKYDLTLQLRERDEGGFDGSFEYSTDLFEPETIDHLARVFVHLLGGLVNAPDCPIGEIPLMGSADVAQLCDVWGQGAPQPPYDATVLHAIEAAAGNTPDAPAILFECETWSFEQLYTRAQAIGAALGPVQGERVLLCLERTPQMIAGLLGILMAGATCVPIEPGHPTMRKRRIARLARAVAIVTEDEPFAGLAAVAPDVPAPKTAPPVAINPNDEAYILFTSGSTGKPKGVVVEHGHLAAHVAASGALFDIDDHSVGLLFSTIAFDAAFDQIFPFLCRGRPIVLRGEAVWNASTLAQAVTRHNITHMDCTPSYLAAVLDSWPVCDVALPRVCVAGGEPLPAAVLAAWSPLAPPNGVLINAYGPTETTVTAVAHIFAPSDPVPDAIPIGRPLAGRRAYVLDAQGALLPEGVEGELYLGGSGVARGYLDQPEATAQVFLPNPFAPGERIYRTGDRAVWRAGHLFYRGRQDAQIKLRGFRIEPGEIENTLRQHRAVSDAHALVRGDRLLVYAVAPGMSGERLRVFAAKRLPAHMVPATITVLPHLPLTAQGKVDIAALPGLQSAPPPVSGSGDGMETLVRSLYAVILGLDWVPGNGDFFALGGHSLAAARLSARLGQALGRDVDLRLIFAHPTTAALAQALRNGQGGLAAPALRIAPPGGPTPLSHGQERLWILDKIGGPGAQQAYLLPLALNLSGGLDLVALEAALAGLVARHDCLAARVNDTDQGPVFVPGPVPDPILTRYDIAGLTADEAEAVLNDAARRGFDLNHQAPFRASLYSVGRDEWILLLVMHHIAADGWSLNVLGRDLGELYRAAHKGEAARLSAPALRYRDYAAWDRSQAVTGWVDQAMPYWRDHLRDAPKLIALPHDLPRPPNAGFAGGHVAVTISAPVVQTLRAVGQGAGATLYMVGLAAFAALLHRVGNTTDLVVGTPITNRPHPDLEQVCGMFVNTLALRFRCDDETGFDDLLAQARDITLGGLAHGHVPFEHLVEALNPPRDPSHSPIFQVMFALEPAPPTLPSLDDVTVRPVSLRSGVAKLDLTLDLEETADGTVQGLLEYNTGLFTPAAATRLARAFESLCAHFSAHPGAAVSGFADGADWGAPPPPAGRMPHQTLVSDGDTRARLLQLWQRVLGPDGTAMGDFFAQGGTSLAAVRLAGLVQREFGQPCAVADVFLHPDFDDLAGFIAAGGADRGLLRVVQQGDGPVVLCLPPATGLGLWAASLARHLPDDVTVIACDLSELNPASTTIARVQTLAQRVVEEYHRLAPSGPLHLVGYSFGGLLAFEIFQHLGAARLVVIDADAPQTAPPMPPQSDAELLHALLAKDGAPRYADLPQFLGWAQERNILPKGMGLAELHHLLAITRATTAAGDAYDPGAIDGALTLIRASDGEAKDENLGWGAFARGGVTLSWVPGNHASIVRAPNIAALAALIVAQKPDAPNPE